ncbi:PD-(D/E)XK nuclease family protein [Nocardia rhamnosiphila]
MRSDKPVRLVRRKTAAPRARTWGADVGALFAAPPSATAAQPDPDRIWRVLGGPGTGKTALLIDVAATRIAAGADPESVLLLTHSKQAAAAARDALTERLDNWTVCAPVVAAAGSAGGAARAAEPTADPLFALAEPVRPPSAVPGVAGATREPLARTIHSYAFGVLRRQAARHGNPPPRLLTGAEQDAVLREMLRGDMADIAAGAGDLWPRRLQPALGLTGFADELRDLMLRATERGLGPEDLIDLGRRRDRPDWIAAGDFAARYEQAMLLRWSVGVAAPEASAPALNAAELVGAALDALAGDPELLAAERARLRCLLVDDAQHLDPQAALLVRVLAAGAGTTMIAGDPDQAVYTFRGADSRFLTEDSPPGRRIVLYDNHRSGPAITTATARIASRLPGRVPHRTTRADLGPAERGELPPDTGAEPPVPAEVRVRVLGSPAKEASLIADHLRRAHLTEGVPWSQMAVIVRSVPLLLPPLRRALLAAGVPIAQPANDIPLARRRGAAWMLLALRAVLAGEATRRGTGSTESLFGPDEALDLLAGPLGGADAISLRRLRRGIRRAAVELARTPHPAAALGADSAGAPDLDTVAARGPDTVAAPGPDIVAAPGPDIAGASDPDLDATPGQDIVAAPGPDIAGAPDPDLDATPGPNLAGTAGPNLAGAPDPDLDATPGPNLADTAGPNLAGASGPGLADAPGPDLAHIPDSDPARRADPDLAVPPDLPPEPVREPPVFDTYRAEDHLDELPPRDLFAEVSRHRADADWYGIDAESFGDDPWDGLPPEPPVDEENFPPEPYPEDGEEPDVSIGAKAAGPAGTDSARFESRGRAGGPGTGKDRREPVDSGRMSDSGALQGVPGNSAGDPAPGTGPGKPVGSVGGSGPEAAGTAPGETVDESEAPRTDPRTSADGTDADPRRSGPQGSAPDRPSVEVLRELLLGAGDDRIVAGLTEVEIAPLERAARALDRARRVRREGGGLEDVLWALWTGSRLERRWLAQSRRGGAAGMQADRDLDAAVALFDAAAAYTDRLPGATIEGFVEYLLQQQIPQDRAVRTQREEAVDLLSAHAAAGREWEVVAVAGVQEGIWPDPRPRGTLLHTEDLVDEVAGITERVSRAAPVLAEERRLLFVACSRARRSLLVTAVESVTGERDLVPSRFLSELLGGDTGGEPGALPVAEPGRVLALHALIAELRAVVCDPGAGDERRRRAARQLARLALAGIPGTAPDDWYGVPGLSSTETLWDDDAPIALSPSTVELLRTCPLRWALERNGGSDGENPYAVKGTLVHTLVQALAGRVPLDQVRAELARSWSGIDPETSWYSRQELRRTEAMLDAFVAWVRTTRGELTQAGIEVPVDCVLPAPGDDTPEVRIRGRIDRLERDAAGRFVIVDVKTGKNPVSEADAAQHAQLATYQVAAAAGALEESAGDPEPGGARLVYVGLPAAGGVAKERVQPALDAEALETWRETIHAAAASTEGPGFLAIRNEGCRHCAVKNSCPVQDAGRQVTDE